MRGISKFREVALASSHLPFPDIVDIAIKPRSDRTNTSETLRIDTPPLAPLGTTAEAFLRFLRAEDENKVRGKGKSSVFS